MSSRLITPPAALAVSLDTARAAARLDEGQDDSELIQAIRTYTQEAEKKTRRVLITQTWRLTRDEFSPVIELPRAPLQTVVHVKFYDAAGLQRTLAPQDYLADAESEPGCVVPAPGRIWPVAAARINAVEVEYVAGYGADETAVPDAIKGYIIEKVREHFAPVGTPKNAYLHCLLDGFWVAP